MKFCLSLIFFFGLKKCFSINQVCHKFPLFLVILGILEVFFEVGDSWALALIAELHTRVII